MSPVLATLGDFISAGLRPRTPLAKAISVALLVKLCVIVWMRIYLFGGDVRPHVDGSVVEGHLLGPAASHSRKVNQP